MVETGENFICPGCKLPFGETVQHSEAQGYCTSCFDKVEQLQLWQEANPATKETPVPREKSNLSMEDKSRMSLENVERELRDCEAQIEEWTAKMHQQLNAQYIARVGICVIKRKQLKTFLDENEACLKILEKEENKCREMVQSYQELIISENHNVAHFRSVRTNIICGISDRSFKKTSLVLKVKKTGTRK